MKPDDSRPPWVRDLGIFGVIVADVLGYTGAGVLLGWLAWQKLGWPRWMIAVFSVIGLGLAMVRVYRLARMRSR